MPPRKPAAGVVLLGAAFGSIVVLVILGTVVGWAIGGLAGSSLFGLAASAVAWRDRAELRNRLRTREGRAQLAWGLVAPLATFGASLAALIVNDVLAYVILALGGIAFMAVPTLHERGEDRRARAEEVPMRARFGPDALRPPVSTPPPHSDYCTECGPIAHMRRTQEGTPLTGVERLMESCPCTEALARSFPGVGLISPGLAALVDDGERSIPCLWCHAEAMRQPAEGEELANATESDDPEDEDEATEDDPDLWGPADSS